MIQIFEKGTEVKLKGLGVNGTIEKVEIDGVNLMYNISYFWDGELKIVWLSEYHFEAKGEKIPIGFKK